MYDTREIRDDEAVGSNGGGALKMSIKIRTKPPVAAAVAAVILSEADDGNKKKKKVWACKYCDRPPFDSDKALYGHMRLHNSRKRRGSDHHLDLVKYSSHEKRHKAHTAAVDDDVMNAAVILVSFTNPSTTECSSTSTGADVGGSLRSRAKGNNTCRTCGRSFATYQALGGHMTKHKRDTERHKDDTERHKDAQEQVHEEEEVQGQGRKSHCCSVCNMEFRKGQSLGGHMRKHWVRPAGAETGSSNHASAAVLPPPSSGDAEERGGRDRDLNESP